MFEFGYRLTGFGWAQARVADGDAWISMSVSYLSDALGDLIEAIARVLEGHEVARCSWEDEPGEFRWIFERCDVDTSLRILTFEDQYDEEPDVAGVPIFATIQDPVVIGRAVVLAAEKVLDRYGVDGYLANWIEYPFPEKSLVRLRGLVNG